MTDSDSSTTYPENDRLTLAAATLPRRRFFDDMPDKGLFVAVALTGFLGILLTKTYDLLGAEWVAAGAVAAMLAYGAAAFYMPSVELRPDRLGDNFYYLGFIYTLASLSAALLILRSSARFEELLGNFGIALLTTIVGVAGRVLFVQMRGDIDDVEAKVRRDLVAASADLRSQLVLALREFETFHTGVLQASAEAIQKASQQAENQINAIGALTELSVAKIGASVSAHDTQIDKIGALLMRVHEAIRELPMLGTVELPSERLERQFVSFTSELELLAAELRRVVSETRKQNSRFRWYWPFKSGV